MRLRTSDCGRVLCLFVLVLGLDWELKITEGEGNKGSRTSFEEVPHDEGLDLDNDIFEETEVLEPCHGVADDTEEWQKVLVLVASQGRDVELEAPES